MSDTILDLTDESDAVEEAGGTTLPAVGTQLGRYRLLRLLQSAPGAAMYEVEIEPGSRGALCLLGPESGRSPGGATAGRMSALKALREVNNPHLPAITDLIEAARPGQPEAVVMELVTGRSLAQLVTEEGPLPSERIVFILAQALDAARALQRVKLRQGPLGPEAILVTSASGTDDYVRLAGLELTDPGGDMRAFGMTLQLLLRGSPAKPSSDPLRPTLHAIARGCLGEDLPAAWHSLDELKTVFDSLLCGETVDLPGLIDPFDNAPSSPRRKRWLVAVPVAALALALVGGVLLRGRGAPHPTPAPHASPVSAAAPSIPAEPQPPKPAQPAPPAPAAMTPPPPVEEVPAPPSEPAAAAAVAPAPPTPAEPAAAPAAPPPPSARSKPEVVAEPSPGPEKVRPRPARPSGRALREGTINPFGD